MIAATCRRDARGGQTTADDPLLAAAAVQSALRAEQARPLWHQLCCPLAPAPSPLGRTCVPCPWQSSTLPLESTALKPSLTREPVSAAAAPSGSGCLNSSWVERMPVSST